LYIYIDILLFIKTQTKTQLQAQLELQMTTRQTQRLALSLFHAKHRQYFHTVHRPFDRIRRFTQTYTDTYAEK